MFWLTAFAYPAVLAALSLGVGLGIDRASGGRLPAPLIAPVGVAGLIAVSQLETYAPALAPGTPYVLAALAAAGWLAGWQRLRAGASSSRLRTCAPWLTVGPIAYLVALAPVLAAGRATLSSYMALTDSAVHILGADYILAHGQSFGHLHLANSAGQYLSAYYGHGYPSGADTLFGASAMLAHCSLLFAYQPFCAFMVALASGPAWLLARRLGLGGVWAAVAALAATVPALVYAYELVGSVKELVALPLLMALGAMVVTHAGWLRGRPRAAVPFGLLVAGGVSAIGIAFGAWALGTVVVIVVLAVAAVRAGTASTSKLLGAAAAAGVVLVVAAWPTWAHLSSSLEVAQAIASTTNPGNLHHRLRIVQALGVWLNGTYLVEPSGVAFWATYACIALTAAAALVGVWHTVRAQRALAGWIALMVCVWLGLTESGSTWADAKTLMLTSPVVVLLAWAGVAALGSRRARAWPVLAAVLSLGLIAEVLASDAMQYHASNLAPTARYEELSSLNGRFAGRGPALFTDYDEYAMYELRDLEVGGPNFIYPPPALAGVVPSHGYPVEVDRIAAAKLAAYPLIITRRNPRAARPPAAYSLTWQGTYYQVWARRRKARLPVAGTPAPVAGALSCQSIAAVATAARAHGDLLAGGGARAGASPHAAATLVAAIAPELLKLRLAGLRHTRRWTRGRIGLLLNGPGSLEGSFIVPRPGLWDVWIEGQLMPEVHIGLDGHRIGSISGQVGGTSLTQQVMPPLLVKLAAGTHRLAIERDASGLAPGEGGWADIRAIYLTPAGAGSMAQLVRVPTAHWRSLCSRRLEWVQALPRRSAA